MQQVLGTGEALLSGKRVSALKEAMLDGIKIEDHPLRTGPATLGVMLGKLLQAAIWKLKSAVKREYTQCFTECAKCFCNLALSNYSPGSYLRDCSEASSNPLLHIS